MASPKHVPSLMDQSGKRGVSGVELGWSLLKFELSLGSESRRFGGCWNINQASPTKNSTISRDSENSPGLPGDLPMPSVCTRNSRSEIR